MDRNHMTKIAGWMVGLMVVAGAFYYGFSRGAASAEDPQTPDRHPTIAEEAADRPVADPLEVMGQDLVPPAPYEAKSRQQAVDLLGAPLVNVTDLPDTFKPKDTVYMLVKDSSVSAKWFFYDPEQMMTLGMSQWRPSGTRNPHPLFCSTSTEAAPTIKETTGWAEMRCVRAWSFEQNDHRFNVQAFMLLQDQDDQTKAKRILRSIQTPGREEAQ